MQWIWILGLIVLIACNSNDVLHYYPEDKSQCITVITEGEFRWIISGRYTSKPDTNYVMISLENVDPIGEAIYICWDVDGNGWNAIVEDAVVIESKLSESFDFSNSLPKNSMDIPTTADFNNENCLVYDNETKQLLTDSKSMFEVY